MAVFTPHRVTVADVPNHDHLYQSSTVQDNRFSVGDKFEDEKGSIYRYCKSGAAVGGLARGVVNGNIIPGDTGDGYEGSLVSAAAAGDYTVTITDTSSAANRPVNYYQGGMFVAFIATNYFTCGITKSAVGNGTSIEITLDAAIPVACSASVGITAYPSPYNKIKNGMAQLQDFETFVCVPMCSNIAATATYFWGMTRGQIWVTAHGGTWPGSSACLRDVYFHIDGTIDPASIRVVGTLSPQRAGYLLHAGSSGSYGDGLIMLQLE